MSTDLSGQKLAEKILGHKMAPCKRHYGGPGEDLLSKMKEHKKGLMITGAVVAAGIVVTIIVIQAKKDSDRNPPVEEEQQSASMRPSDLFTSY